MNSRGARVWRGGAAASVSTLVAACSHAAGGGHFPSVAILAFVFAFAALVCIALTGRNLSGVRVAASVVISQTMFHAVFSWPTGSGSIVSGVGQHEHRLIVTAPASAPMAEHMSGWMLLSHLIAAVVTAAALIQGERVLRRLIDSARLTLSTLLGWVDLSTVRTVADTRPTAGSVVVPLSFVILSSIRRRGPPVHPVSI